MASNFSLLDPLAKINQMKDETDLMYAGYRYRKAQRDLEARGDIKTQQANNSQMWDIFKGGVWGDYSKGDAVTKVQAKDKNGNPKYDKKGNPVMKNEYHAGAIAQDVLGNTARYGAIAMSFMKDKETANNSLNDYATQFRKQGQSALMSSGNPYLMTAGALSMLSDKVGGTASASKTGNFWTDAGNTVASFVPFLGFAGKKAGTFNELADVNASSMYANIGDVYGAREHSGGSFIFGGNDIKNKIEDSNRKAFIISNDILQPGKRDLASAMDNRWGISAEFDLNGGPDRVTNFGLAAAKQGAVLQFTKRTLSKSKVKKHQGGGNITKDQVNDPDEIPTKLPPFIHYNSKENYFYTDVWGDSPQEHKDQLLAYVKHKFPKGWKVWYNPMLKDEDMQYSILPENLYNKIAQKFVDNLPLGPAESKISQYTINQWVPIEGKMLKYIGEDEDNISETGAPVNFVDEQGNGYYYPTYKAGGKVNVIPDGALHKNKHHLEEVDEKFEDVTTKGIPVIVESEDGEVIQQAEVEREEIIFRLEVTKKLEELSKKHTDEAAIEAGKLLVKEILYNTEDNTGKMI